MRLFITLITVMLLSTPGIADVINIPDDVETIQGGINAAENGDTVQVADGEYAGHIDFIGRDITVRGNPENPEEVIIRGNDARSIVIFENAESNEAVLAGFTIMNGVAEYGAGIRIVNNASPVLHDLIIRDNQATESGGGIYISGNVEMSWDNIDIRDNVSRASGALTVSGATLELNDARIVNNQGGRGGAINCVSEATITLNRVDILDNTTQDYVINIEYQNSSMILTDCRIVGNSGLDLLRTSRSVFEAYHTLFACGGGEFETRVLRFKWDAGQPCLLVNCTIAGFPANSLIDATDDGQCRILNSVIFGNNDESNQFIIGDVEMRYSLCPGNRGETNIDGDPLFADPDNHDFHLTENSPCIDAGDPDSPDDSDGTRSDMGAFYFHQNFPPELVGGIADVTIEEDADRLVIAALDTVIADGNGMEDLIFEIIADENLGLEIDEEYLLSLQPSLNFFGEDLQTTLRAIDRDDTVSVSFLVNVIPVNDPPTEFDLLLPQDEIEIYWSDTVSFSWQESFEPDGDADIQYILEMLFWEDTLRWDCEGQTTITLPDSGLDSPFFNNGDVGVVYAWWVRAISGQDTIESTSQFSLSVMPESVDWESNIAKDFILYPAYPNPFNSSTTFSYTLPLQSGVTLQIYNVRGQLVDMLLDGVMPAGRHSVVWDGHDLCAGVYLVRFENGVDNQIGTQKIVLVK